MDQPVILQQKQCPFTRGNGEWKGGVMIERPRNAEPETMCKVRSARTSELAGFRAIACEMPYASVRHFFKAGDGAEVCVWAEFGQGYLQLYERISKREFFLNAGPLPGEVGQAQIPSPLLN